MANSKLESRIKKLEEKTSKGRWVYPTGYFYSEEGCDPYWTEDPVKPFSAWYDEIKQEKTGKGAYRKTDKPNC